MTARKVAGGRRPMCRFRRARCSARHWSFERRSDARAIVPAVRQAIWSEFPDAVPTRIDEQALGTYFDALVAQRRFNMLLLGLFGVLGLMIATVGIYGVMAYVVSQRTQEIGIRMALGAVPSTILMSVLGGALLYMIAGLAIGLLGAWGLAELVRGFLFEIQPHDPTVYAGVLAGARNDRACRRILPGSPRGGRRSAHRASDGVRLRSGAVGGICLCLCAQTDHGFGGLSICLWQYSQSALIVVPSFAARLPSWQRKQPADVMWPRLSG